MSKTRKLIQDKSQSSIFDFAEDLLSEKNKLELIQSIQNRIEDVIDNKEKFEKSENSSNLRSEEIIISKNNYPSIQTSDNKYQFNQSIEIFSECCHHSKNIYNQCLYQIRLSFLNKMDLNVNSDKERQLRIDVRNALNKYKSHSFEKLKKSNYKNQIFSLLDKYFKGMKNIYGKNENDNYSWSPQASQQIIDVCVEAWLDNDLGRRDYDQHPEHRKDYAGRPGLPNYKQSSEFVSVFTNQQCHIENRDIFDINSINDVRPRSMNKNFLNFPDHLGIKSIETRLSSNTDLREVRIIPFVRKGYYKIELIYKKVIDKIKIGKDKIVEISELDLNKENIIGIDLGKVNTVTIANNIGLRPIVVKGGFTLSISQWYNKISSKLYQIYYRQQKFQGLKGQKLTIGKKLQIQIQNRSNRLKDLFHKLSRYIINYCIDNKVGTIIIGRNPFWKQNIKLGDRTNQNFVYIPFDLFIRMMKYKATEIGIDLIVNEEAHTSKCSFLDNEPIGHKEKGQYVGERLTKKGHRGLFRTKLGKLINSDVNGAYNIIKKVRPNAFGGTCSASPTSADDNIKGHGTIVGDVLHPVSIGIKDLLSIRRIQCIIT